MSTYVDAFPCHMCGHLFVCDFFSGAVGSWPLGFFLCDVIVLDQRGGDVEDTSQTTRNPPLLVYTNLDLDSR